MTDKFNEMPREQIEAMTQKLYRDHEITDDKIVKALIAVHDAGVEAAHDIADRGYGCRETVCRDIRALKLGGKTNE